VRKNRYRRQRLRHHRRRGALQRPITGMSSVRCGAGARRFLSNAFLASQSPSNGGPFDFLSLPRSPAGAGGGAAVSGQTLLEIAVTIRVSTDHSSNGRKLPSARRRAEASTPRLSTAAASAGDRGISPRIPPRPDIGLLMDALYFYAIFGIVRFSRV